MMKRWCFFFLMLLVSVSDALLVAYTYFGHNDVAPLELKKATDFAGYLVGGAFSVTVILAALFQLARSLRKNHVKTIVRRSLEKDPWYVQLCQILMTSTILIIMFSLSYFGIEFDKGQWMAGGGKGLPMRPVSEQQAVLFLWRNLRVYFAFFLFISLGWLLFAISLIRRRRKEE